jgi:hypothetical protein
MPWKIGEVVKRVRESSGSGWIEQSKAYSQQGYIEKPLETLT